MRATPLHLVSLVLATVLPGCVFASAQQASPAAQSLPTAQSSPAAQSSPRCPGPTAKHSAERCRRAKSGAPVTGLGQQDFTLLDNNAPHPIASFKPMSAAQEPVNVIVLVDAVNVDFDRVAYARAAGAKVPEGK